MALAALFSGLALGNAGLGSVHGFAGVIGGMVLGPHGAICAALLPHAIRVNVRAFRERAADSPALDRFAELGRILTGAPSAAAAEAVQWIDEMCAALRVPPLKAYGLERRHFPELLDKAAVASSMKANPIALTRDEMEEIVLAAWGPRPGISGSGLARCVLRATCSGWHRWGGTRMRFRPGFSLRSSLLTGSSFPGTDSTGTTGRRPGSTICRGRACTGRCSPAIVRSFPGSTH